VRDDSNATSTQSVTVTGADHIPAFTGGATSAFVTESTTESITNPTSVTQNRTGTLGFSDRDRGDTHTVWVSAQDPVWVGGGDVTTLSAQTLDALAHALTATLPSDSAGSGSGTIAWNFGVTDNIYDFMSAGQTLTLAYDVTVRDSHSKTSAPQTVTVAVHGSNKSLVYDTLGNVHATANFPNQALSVSNVDDSSTNQLAVWTAAQYHAHDSHFSYGGLAPLLLVNAANGAVLVELNAIKQLDFHLGNQDDTLDVSETVASPVRTVPIAADGGSFPQDGAGNRARRCLCISPAQCLCSHLCPQRHHGHRRRDHPHCRRRRDHRQIHQLPELRRRLLFQ
jgi:hypothetical protein